MPGSFDKKGKSPFFGERTRHIVSGWCFLSQKLKQSAYFPNPNRATASFQLGKHIKNLKYVFILQFSSDDTDK
jgi:hypothetical protein